MNNLVSTAVIYRQKHSHFPIILRILFEIVHFLLKIFVKYGFISKKQYPNFFSDVVSYVYNIFPEQLYNSFNLVLRPFPVFSGKSVKGNIFYAYILAISSYSPEIFSALPMAESSGHSSFFSPSSVAVHDESYMSGQVIGETARFIFIFFEKCHYSDLKDS